MKENYQWRLTACPLNTDNIVRQKEGLNANHEGIACLSLGSL